ncbi:hypothetical protein MEE_01444 [Bartonella elizabethae F9251 = ATCC 49927]|uniref:Uncharacterized protein n=1 Tax=Bartonella elizabethae F9251 = ATCC 49927 TaxID=1094555 RepID=J0RD94_BAREL|nr:hypothetical protein MEE_01444 [Bartonella elizabethae F9251 = ATCC 49927]VEJ41893.1 Uncharacterised protein [Bartonella elizabethae]
MTPRAACYLYLFHLCLFPDLFSPHHCSYKTDILTIFYSYTFLRFYKFTENSREETLHFQAHFGMGLVRGTRVCAWCGGVGGGGWGGGAVVWRLVTKHTFL